MRRLHAANEVTSLQVERQGCRASTALRDDVSFWKSWLEPLQVRRGQQAVGRQSGMCFLDKTGFEVHQIKGITDFQEPVKLLLWHDFPMRFPACAWGSAGKPRLGHSGECIGMDVTEKNAIGRIRCCCFIAA